MKQESQRIAFEETGPLEMARDFFFNRLKWRTRISRSEFETYSLLLAKHSAFYRELSPDMKAKTINRVVAFASSKKFVGHGLDVTMEMKLTVAFAAVKLTFGFESYLIPILHTIHIASGAFYTPMIKQQTTGLTSENGTMYLAWDSVLSGIENEEDGLYLAVHEMAHALKIDTVKGSPSKERFAFYLNTWLKEAEVAKATSDYRFIRAYGKTNMHEFFAVCMENFVERPAEFYKHEPSLFAHTCYLLNQFPLEPKRRELTATAVSSLAKRTGVRFPKASAKDYSHHSWHWSLTLLMISVFVSPAFIMGLTLDAHLPIDGWAFYIMFCLIAAVLFYRPVILYKALSIDKYFAFILFGGGPLLYSGALVVDAVLPVHRWEESSKVLNASPDLFKNKTLLTLEDEALMEWEEITELPIGFMQDYRGNPNMTMHAEFGVGIMGITRLKESWYTVAARPSGETVQ